MGSETKRSIQNTPPSTETESVKFGVTVGGFRIPVTILKNHTMQDVANSVRKAIIEGGKQSLIQEAYPHLAKPDSQIAFVGLGQDLNPDTPCADYWGFFKEHAGWLRLITNPNKAAELIKNFEDNKQKAQAEQDRLFAKKISSKWRMMPTKYHIIAGLLFVGGIAIATLIPFFLELSLPAAKFVVFLGAIFSITVALGHALHVAIQTDRVPPPVNLIANAFGETWRATGGWRWVAAAVIGLSLMAVLASFALPVFGIATLSAKAILGLQIGGGVLAGITALGHMYHIEKCNDPKRYRDLQDPTNLIGGFNLSKQMKATGNARYFAWGFAILSIVAIVIGGIPPDFLSNYSILGGAVNVANIFLGGGITIFCVTVLGHTIHALAQRIDLDSRETGGLLTNAFTTSHAVSDAVPLPRGQRYHQYQEQGDFTNSSAGAPPATTPTTATIAVSSTSGSSSRFDYGSASTARDEVTANTSTSQISTVTSTSSRS